MTEYIPAFFRDDKGLSRQGIMQGRKLHNTKQEEPNMEEKYAQLEKRVKIHE